MDNNLTPPPALKQSGEFLIEMFKVLNRIGVCAGSVKICNGGWGEPNYAAYSPDYQVIETRCDGLDNDYILFFF